jgi:hypothetical protein
MQGGSRGRGKIGGGFTIGETFDYKHGHVAA